MKNLKFPIALALSVFTFLSAAADQPVVKKAEAKEVKTEEELRYENYQKHRFDFIKTLDKKRFKTGMDILTNELVLPAPEKDNTELLSKIKKIPMQQTPPKAEKKAPCLHFYDDFIMVNGDEEIKVSMVFNNAPLLDVIPAFADALGFSFLADSTLKGVVTLNIDQKMPRRDLWNTFDRMLNLAGAGVTVDGSLLRIVALDKLARQPDSRLSSKADGELFYYNLKNASAKEAVTQIKPFLGISGVAVELTRPNAILVADDRANMPKIKQLLETIDRAGKVSWKRKVFSCRNILPSRLVEELQTVLPVLGFNVFLKTDRLEHPGSIQLTGLDRLQLLVVSAATEEAITEIGTWVNLLDSSDSLDQERVFVYKVRHNKAQQLAQALSVIYDIQGSSLTIDSTTGNTKLESVNSTATNRNRNQQYTQNNRNNTAVSKTTNTQTDRSSNIFDTPVRVFADGSLNRLVVRTTPRTYASIKALLDRLDVVPAQVLLQVLVVEVTLTDATQFGVEFSLDNQIAGNDSLFGSNFANLVPSSKTTTTTSGTSRTAQTGYTWTISDPNNPATKFGYIRALAGKTQVKVVSSPQLLITSNSEASIQVGSEVPYLSQGISNTQSSTDVLQNYQQKNVGIILTVTPQITSNDYIAMKVKQELSQAIEPAADAAIQSPTFDQRIVQTTMTIANGKTMIIGGLIQEKVNDHLDSVPIISQIPVLNRLLGSTDATVERTEVLVMITGYIVNERSKIEELIERYNSSIRTLNDFQNTLGNSKKKPRKKEESGVSSWIDSIFKPNSREDDFYK